MSSKTKAKAKPKKAPAKKTKPKASKPRASKPREEPQEAPKPAPKPAPKAEARREEKVQKTKPVEKPKVPAVVAPEKLGRPPAASVSSRHLDSMHQRPGRGFSFAELEAAGVPENRAKREGLPIDVRRRSVVDGNVEALKAWYTTPAP